ncbi:MAG: PQQ-binding-like beta-propeller repeat protein [Deltaproteobacteria bacterium]|nr:PQQ-binding-like beta-propeller repeat protein [Deltaproteobacteria bacterium]
MIPRLLETQTELRALVLLLWLLPAVVTCGSGSSEFTQPIGVGAPAGWPTYGGDAGGSRFSPLDQIHRGNVGRLRVAWTYRTGDWPGARSDLSRTTFQATPILDAGTLYLCSPANRIFALDAETGAERWIFDAKPSYTGGWSRRGRWGRRRGGLRAARLHGHDGRAPRGRGRRHRPRVRRLRRGRVGGSPRRSRRRACGRDVYDLPAHCGGRCGRDRGAGGRQPPRRFAGWRDSWLRCTNRPFALVFRSGPARYGAARTGRRRLAALSSGHAERLVDPVGGSPARPRLRPLRCGESGFLRWRARWLRPLRERRGRARRGDRRTGLALPGRPPRTLGL